MIEKVLHRLLQRKHFWRHATFGEVAELYSARLLRMTASSLITLFIVVYLYRNGFSLVFIAGYYAVYFFAKSLIAMAVAHYVARYGPKHGMLIANIINIPSLIVFSLVPEYGLAAVIFYSFLRAISLTMYSISHMVDFSKVKHIRHAGKEISTMNIMDKVAAGLSPLIGGMIAWFASPEVSLWIAALLYLGAALPLFRTAEPVRVGQKISFEGFSWKMLGPSFGARICEGFDLFSNSIVWTMFLTITIFATSDNEIYAQLGGLTSITLIAGFIVSRVYGNLIDKRRGRELLQYTTIGAAAVNFIRPFVNNVPIAGAVNVVNEAMLSGHSMAFMRGMFDNADRSGRRITYLMLMEVAAGIGSSVGSAVFFVLLITLPEITAFYIMFVVSGVVVLGIATARFPLYR